MDYQRVISQQRNSAYGAVVDISASTEEPEVLIICEHASNHIPKPLQQLGLRAEILLSHVAWDPGARGVAQMMRDRLPAVLVQSCTSRLVYDCNRPPHAPSAIPTRSEIYDIPGNANLSAEQRQERINQVYHPFKQAVREQISLHQRHLGVLVTIHSFTPVYHGEKRQVELGILHGHDDRFARAMLQRVPEAPSFDIRLNEPYSANDGVTHTLDLHAAGNGMMNVMIEIRNDLIQTPETQKKMAHYLADWVARTLDDLSRGRE